MNRKEEREERKGQQRINTPHELQVEVEVEVEAEEEEEEFCYRLKITSLSSIFLKILSMIPSPSDPKPIEKRVL